MAAATFYAATKTLLAYINVSMHTVPAHTAAQYENKEAEEVNARRAEPTLDARLIVSLGKKSTAREVIVMAALVLLTKMRYGLDGEER